MTTGVERLPAGDGERVTGADPVYPSEWQVVSRDWVNWVRAGRLGSNPEREPLGQRVSGYITRDSDPVSGPVNHFDDSTKTGPSRPPPLEPRPRRLEPSTNGHPCQATWARCLLNMDANYN